MRDEPSQIQHDLDKDPNAPAPELTATQARQARPEGVVRYVLGFGLPLALVALAVVVIVFVI